MTTLFDTTHPDRSFAAPGRRAGTADIVGSVGEDTVTFRGFASAAEAVVAAMLAQQTLERVLVHGVDTPPAGFDTRVHDDVVDAHEFEIEERGRRIGTLLRPRPGGDDTYGFELRVPVPVGAERMREVAEEFRHELRRFELSRTSATGTSSGAYPVTESAAPWARVRGAMRRVPAFVLLVLAVHALVTRQLSPLALILIASAGLVAAIVSESNRPWQPRAPLAARGERGNGRSHRPSPRIDVKGGPIHAA